MAYVKCLRCAETVYLCNCAPPVNAAAICGNCGKRLSEHHHEDEVYCNTFTNGDVFTDDPSDDTLMAWLREKHPSFIDDETAAWKRANGHT